MRLIQISFTLIVFNNYKQYENLKNYYWQMVDHGFSASTVFLALP